MRMRMAWWLGALLLATVQPVLADETVTYYLTDAQGTVLMTEDANGVTTAIYDYRPYGVSEGVPTPTGPGYTGHVNDPGTGLVYMQQRYYDPNVGRFLSVDPVTAYAKPESNFNRYAYANNNPYRFTDPDGRYTCEGSKQDCAKVDQYVGKVREARRSRNLTLSERAKVRTVSNYLGEKGEGGPRITPTALPKDTKANTDQRGNIKIDINKNPAGADPVVHGAMALGHEAQHDVDAQVNGEAHTREVATQRERNAYGTEALIGKANGLMLSPAAIEGAVQGSIMNAFGPEPERPDETP